MAMPQRVKAHRRLFGVRAIAAIMVSILGSAHLVPAALATEALTLSGGRTLTFSTVSGTTQIDIQEKGARQSIRVVRDGRVAPAASPIRVKLVAEIASSAAIVVDTYPSVGAGMARCRAGEESFLRVISFARAPALDTLRIKLESCRDDIELASPGLAWDPATATLSVRWLSGPTSLGKEEELTLRIQEP
jgi:hypothetical protein